VTFLLLACVAALAMVVQDILGIVLLLAATRNRGSLAGIMDSLQWLVGITTTTISVSVLQGHSLYEKAVVIVLVTLANFFGTVWGEKLGTHFVKDKGRRTHEERLKALEMYVENNNHSG
jgi:hypothetical protein